MKFRNRVLVFLMLITLIINLYPSLQVKAVSNNFHKAGGLRDAYYYTDSTELPTGDFYFFYKWGEGKCWYTTSLKGAIALCNKQGMVFKPEYIASVWSPATLLAAIVDSSLNLVQHLVYTSQNDASDALVETTSSNCVGVAINDITGCTLDNHSGTGGSFAVDSWVNNIVHEVVDDMTSTIPPDFINFPTVTDNQFKSYSNTYDSLLNTQYSILDNLDNIGRCYFKISNNTAFISSDSSGYDYKEFTVIEDFNNLVFTFSSSTVYDNICSVFGLTQDNNVINLTDLLGLRTNYYVRNCQLNFYDKTTFASTSVASTSYTYNANGYTAGNTSNRSSYYFTDYRNNGDILVFMSNIGWVTVYKSASIPAQIKDNLYKPSVLTSNTWNNYDYSQENSTTVTTTQIQNSTNTNTEIYNNTSTEINNNTSTYNYYYNYDNSSTVIDNSVHNYYGDGGGSGGGGDDDNDSIWDKLLEALGGLFDKLGDIITVIATGIISIFTTILGLITEITTNFTSITDTLSAFFSWIPTEIMTPIILGVNLMILIILLNAIKR